MTIAEAKLIAKLLRMATSRLIHSMGIDARIVLSYRQDEKRHEQEDNELIEKELGNQ
jgi:hypothetical protein